VFQGKAFHEKTFPAKKRASLKTRGEKLKPGFSDGIDEREF
jgi:hypothetical protein